MTELGTIVNPRVADADAERKVRLEVFVLIFMWRSSPSSALMIRGLLEIVYSDTAASMAASGLKTYGSLSRKVLFRALFSVQQNLRDPEYFKVRRGKVGVDAK